SLAQDGDPRQARLKAFQAKAFEQGGVSVQRDAPLVVVVGQVLGSGGGPGTTFATHREPGSASAFRSASSSATRARSSSSSVPTRCSTQSTSDILYPRTTCWNRTSRRSSPVIPDSGSRVGEADGGNAASSSPRPNTTEASRNTTAATSTITTR